MHVTRTTAIRSILALLIGFCGLVCSGSTHKPRRPTKRGADRDPVYARPAARCRRGAVRAGVGPRPVQRARSGGDDQYRQRIAGCDRAHSHRCQRFRAGRHQRAHSFFVTSKARRRSRPYSCCSTNRPMPSSPAKAVASTRSPISRAKTLASPRAIFSFRLWPALARQNGIKATTVKQNRISAAVREPILVGGTGRRGGRFSYLSAVNLRDRGVPADDLRCCATPITAARPTASLSSSPAWPPPARGGEKVSCAR